MTIYRYRFIYTDGTTCEMSSGKNQLTPEQAWSHGEAEGEFSHPSRTLKTVIEVRLQYLARSASSQIPNPNDQ